MARIKRLLNLCKHWNWSTVNYFVGLECYEMLCRPGIIFTMYICVFISSVSSFTYSSLQDEHKLLIVGILSAQSNFESRQTIRDTWLRLSTNKSLHYFILGKNFCKLPLEDRISPYSCEELKMSFSQTDQLSTSRPRPSSTIARQMYRYKTLFAGFGFLTHHKIVVRRLNILNEIVLRLNSVRVNLIDSATQETVVSALFKSNSGYNKSEPVFVSRAVEPYVLPKGFEGQICMEVLKPLPIFNSCPLSWNNSSGLISFLQLITTRNEKPVPFDSDACSPVSMTFDVYDADDLKLHVESRASRQNKWNDEMALLQSRLITESQHKKDILFVDVIDVYRNLPKKLLLFFVWVFKNKHFSYILKTDDDTFMNLIKVEAELLHIEETLERPTSMLHPYLWWWGSFREQWAVATNGKWRDDHYHSLTYPPFPCGAGYVVGRDLVEFLATNAAAFQTEFQGEDVSMGIWLAGLHTTRHLDSISICDDTSYTYSEKFWNYGHVGMCDTACDSSHYSTWSCHDTCNHYAYNRAQLSLSEMCNTWNAFKKCGSLCNCSSLTTSKTPNV